MNVSPRISKAIANARRETDPDHHLKVASTVSKTGSASLTDSDTQRITQLNITAMEFASSTIRIGRIDDPYFVSWE
jgi:hypothetical protein